jgi:phosphoglycolate phosphatase-like HAD superfamily hydrolase
LGSNQIRHVLFDFDGTLSLIRAGWAVVMARQWQEYLPPVPGENPEDLRATIKSEIWRLNGKPSIHQAARLAEWIQSRGGKALTAETYEADYQERLAAVIHSRLWPVQTGTEAPDAFLVTGARRLLQDLTEAGLILHLASGTVLGYVLTEARALKIDHFFEGRIHGPRDVNDKVFSKRAVIDALLVDWKTPGSSLVAFGDGHVEIQETKAVGGLAIAVASDEEDWRSGKIDEPKRDRLRAVGADYCIPDYQDRKRIQQTLGIPSKITQN